MKSEVYRKNQGKKKRRGRKKEKKALAQMDFAECLLLIEGIRGSNSIHFVEIIV